MKLKVLLLSTASLIMAATSTSQAQTVMTGSDMESWHSILVITSPTLGLTAPKDWHCIDSLVAAIAPLAGIAGVSISPKKMLYKSSDAREGSFAAEVRTKQITDTLMGTVGGVLSNSEIGINIAQALGGDLLSAISYNGGTNITGNNVTKVNAWVKTDSANMDNSSITVLAIKNSGDSGIVVAQGFLSVPKTTTEYTNLEVNVQTILPGQNPDRLVVLFSSSDMSAAGSQTVDNSLKVDGVTYTLTPTGITKPLFEATNMFVYPNPAQGVINFELNANEKAENYSLTIMDLSGRIISTESLNQQTTVKNISTYASGSYFYNLTNVKNFKMETGKFIVK